MGILGGFGPGVLGEAMRVSLTEFFSQLLLFLLIASMAGSCDARLCLLQFRKAKGIVCGLCCHFLVMPFLGYVCVDWLIPQPSVTAVTLLVITTSPSGGFSGFWCSVCNADLALSVAITTASTLVSCAALPLNLLIYVKTISGTDVRLDWWQITISCGVVVVAVAVGLLTSLRLERRGRQLVNRLGSVAGVCLMGMSATSNTMSHDPIYGKPPRWFLGVCLPVPLGLLATFGLSRCLRLEPPEATTVAIECVYQNTALALAISLSAFPRSMAGAATAVPLVYGLAEIVFIFCFGCFAWRMGWSHAPKAANLCEFLVEDYQPEATEDDVAQLRLSERSFSVASTTRGDDLPVHLDAPLLPEDAPSPPPDKRPASAAARAWAFLFPRRAPSPRLSTAPEEPTTAR